MTDPSLTCPVCHYDLRGIGSDRCPECGTAIDRELPPSVNPWLRRREIGRVHAFVATTWLVLRRPTALAVDVHHPVRLSDGRSYRRIAVVIAAGSFAVAIASAGICFQRTANAAKRPFGFRVGIAEWIVAVAVAVGGWLLLLGFTGLPMYWFHPRPWPVVRQNRAVATSHYLSAVVMLVPVFSAMLLVLPWVMAGPDLRGLAFQVVAVCNFLVLLSPIIIAAVMWLTVVRLHHKLFGPSKGSWLTLIFVLPVGWLIVFGLCIFGVPCVVLLVEIVIESYR